MPPAGGQRTPIVSYTWAGWGTQPSTDAPFGISRSSSAKPAAATARDDITRFRGVFQPDQGIFSPGYPLVPPDREEVRLWDFPVGYNTIYTPRSFEAIGFEELRALADSHDITRLAIETRKDQIEKLDWRIKSRNEKNPAPHAAERIGRLTESGEGRTANTYSLLGCARRSRMSSC